MRRETRKAFSIVAILLAGIGALAWQAQSQPPSLAARVEKLMADAAATPTNAQNATERAEILDDWAGELSLRGIPIPLELPQTMGQLKGRPGAPGPALLRGTDALIQEMTLKQKYPNRLGMLRANATSGPLVVDGYGVIEVVYTVGDVPIQPGGALKLGKHANTDGGLPQATDPKAANYVTFRCSNPGVKLRVGTSMLQGPNGGFRGAQPYPAVFVEQARLKTGDTITLTIGDRSGGGPGLKLQHTTNDRLIMPIYVDFEGKGIFAYMDNPYLRVWGGAIRGISMVGPSIVGVGETFALRVRVEDQFWNPAAGPAPGFEVTLDGQPYRKIEAGGGAAISVDNVSVAAEGAHYFGITSRDGLLVAESNPVLVKKSPKNRIYWGETHGHTGWADGQGTEDGYYQFARDYAFLDFCALSEHDLWLTRFSWRAVAEATKKYNTPGAFVTFKSYEWTANADRGGHHNVFFRNDDGRPATVRDGAPEIGGLYAGLRKLNKTEDVLVIPHAHQSGTWLTTDKDLQTLVEIYSQHGSFEYFGQKFLNRGQQVGLIAASDNHNGHPGYGRQAHYTRGGLAAVVAPRLDRNAIFDALKGRSAYGTTGERIVIDFELNGKPMGTRVAAAKAPELQVKVAAVTNLDRIEVVKNGKTVYGQDYATGDLRDRLQAQVLFRSASNSPGEELDLPRGERFFRGTLRVRGATLLGAKGVNLDAPESETFKQTNHEIAFRFGTRGDADGLLLELSGVSAATVIEVHLNAAQDGVAAGGSKHQPKSWPAKDMALAFQDLKKSRLALEFGDSDYTDAVTLQVLRDKGTRQAEFRYRDAEAPKNGDYYYIRVTQLDGEQAWSSPIWIQK